MARREHPEIRLLVETAPSGWRPRRDDPAGRFDDRPSTAEQAARVAELREYLAFATVLTLTRERNVHEFLPDRLRSELTAASRFSEDFEYHFVPRYSRELGDVRYNLRAAGARMFAAIVDRPYLLEDVTWPEYEQLRYVWSDARAFERRSFLWGERPLTSIFDYNVQVDRLSIASPAEIVFIVTGPLGVAFAIMVVTQWLATRAEHDRIDLDNKRLAAEAASIVVQKLKSGDLPIPPDAVAAVIENARIAPVPLPPIANVKIDVAAG